MSRLHMLITKNGRDFEIIRVRGGMGGAFRLNIYRPQTQRWHLIDTFPTMLEARAEIRAYSKRYATTKRRRAA